MASSSRRTAVLGLFIIAVFAAACWYPTRLRDEAHFFVLTLVFLLTLVVLIIIARHRPGVFRDDMPDPSCARCGYSLHGHELPSIRCPECGSDLSPSDIIVNKDIWIANVRRRLRWLTLLLILMMLGCPFYLPRPATLTTSLTFSDPVSKAYTGLEVMVFEKAWAFPFGLQIPGTQQSEEMQFGVGTFGGIPGMKSDPLIPWCAQLSYHEGTMAIRRPLDLSGILDWMAACDVDIHSEKVLQEVSAVWACYQAVVNHLHFEPPLKLFKRSRIDRNEKWAVLAWPTWRPRRFAVAGLVLWLLIAVRIRRRAMIEASLVGPHGLTTGRYGHHGCADR